ncbi:hypothetical protein ACFVQ0_02000 [Streptomyces sp. NPDC057900]|uniref:hypothetical protein n=1 Tax=Streptomyces sp. NPDC057900 TaxID=3346274 RepID=UPI0036EA940D
MDRPHDDDVLAAWAPAGMGRIVVVLGRGIVIHKAIVSGRAGAAGVAQGVTAGASVALGGSAVGAASGTNSVYGSPFIEKVLRNGVEGLLASSRMTLVPWDEIVSAEYRKLPLGRGRMIIRTGDTEHKLKFLQNTYVAGDPRGVFAQFLGRKFTAG